MGLRSWFGLDLQAPDVDPDAVAARFAGVEGDGVAGLLYGVPTLDDYIFKSRRVTRAEALAVPAVKRARDLICGAIGQFRLSLYGPDGKPAVNYAPNPFDQPEPGIAPAVTWTRVIENMLLFERAWLRIPNLGWHGRAADFRLLDGDSINVQPEVVQYPEGTAKVWPERAGLIRIDSPNTGLLDCSAAVRACILLQRATLNAVDGVPPLEYFTPADGEDWEDDEITDFLDNYENARRLRARAWIPSGVTRNEAGWDPQKLQLVEAREFAIKEVARATGIDAEDLSVSTTSRTYFNGQDRRRTRIEDVLGPYMSAVEGRLSMDDVTPRGWSVRFDTSSYLRLDDLSAAQTDAVLIASKVLKPEEARVKRGLDPTTTPTDEVDPSEVGAAVAASISITNAQRGANA